MIQRYSRPEMSKIWEDRSKYKVWLRVEVAVCQELAKLKVIPQKDWAQLKKKLELLLKSGGVEPSRVEFHEKITRHDVISFTTAVSEKIGPLSRYIHFGLTSSDVVDTSLSILIQEAGKIIVKDIQELLKVLKRKAIEYKKTATIGRSHGMFAEPTSFGLKFLGWYAEWQRNLSRVENALDQVRFGKLSGAVGVNPHWHPQIEEKVLKALGLKREPVSTQVIPRDRHAYFMTTLALCGSSLERMAIELRHLQRSEVAEVLEGFQKGQKGSSAMPHKRNPISPENITGAARLLRSYGQASLENIALWHERDISHSSVERVILPDATLLLDYALGRMRRVLEELIVNKDQVEKNLKQAGDIVFSGHFLLELVRQGATREDAYQWVQRAALDSMEGKGSFVDNLIQHPEIQKSLTAVQIKKLASIKHQLRHVNEIYREVL